MNKNYSCKVYLMFFCLKNVSFRSRATNSKFTRKTSAVLLNLNSKKIFFRTRIKLFEFEFIKMVFNVKKNYRKDILLMMTFKLKLSFTCLGRADLKKQLVNKMKAIKSKSELSILVSLN